MRQRASGRDGGGVMNRPPSLPTMLPSRHTRRHATWSAIGTAFTVLPSRADYEPWASATSPLPELALAEYVRGETHRHDPTVRMRSRNSRSIFGRSARFRGFQRQNAVKPARCRRRMDDEHCGQKQDREHRPRSCDDSTRRCVSQAVARRSARPRAQRGTGRPLAETRNTLAAMRARIAGEELQRRRLLRRTSAHNPMPVFIGEHRKVLHRLHISPTGQRFPRAWDLDVSPGALSAALEA
jgi:hypothetical protein